MEEIKTAADTENCLQKTPTNGKVVVGVGGLWI